MQIARPSRQTPGIEKLIGGRRPEQHQIENADYDAILAALREGVDARMMAEWSNPGGSNPRRDASRVSNIRSRASRSKLGKTKRRRVH